MLKQARILGGFAKDALWLRVVGETEKNQGQRICLPKLILRVGGWDFASQTAYGGPTDKQRQDVVSCLIDFPNGAISTHPAIQ